MIIPDALPVSLSTFFLISLAEIGDKSQLVCMALAARHRAVPVLAGAAVAFLLLNAAAVLLGAGLAAWVPERLMAAVVAVLFGVFGISALRNRQSRPGDEVRERPGHSVFVMTLALLVAAEFGDKTQLAVAGLAGSLTPWAVWVGASAALLAISALGVWAGRTVLQRVSLAWLHRVSGGLFLLFACLAAWHAVA